MRIPGGTVNMVTKKPLPVKRQAVSFTVGSYDAYRVQADFTGPVNAESTLLYRVNVGYENAGSFRDQIFNESVLVAPSVSFLPDEATRVNVDLVYGINNTRLDRGQAVYGTQDLHSTPISFSLSQPSDHHRLKDFVLNASISRQLTDRLSINASYMKFRWDEDLAEHRTSNQFRNDTTMVMLYGERISEEVTDNVTTYVVGDVETGAIRHMAMLGFDYITDWSDGSSWGAVGTEAGVADFILTRPSYIVRRVDTYTPTSSTGYGEGRGEYSTYGIYVQDQMSLGRLKVLVGLRRDEYVDRLNPGEPGETRVVQTALIPRLGVVYGLGSALNLYGNYSAGFEPVAALYNSNPIYGGPFDPERSHMMEIGAKGEFLDQRLTVTAAAYQIVKTNVLASANSSANPDEMRQRGRERARGFEVEVAGNVATNLSLIAHYALNRTIISEDLDESLIGQDKENAPRHLAGAWAKYQIEEGSLAGIGLGAGFHHVASRFTFERANPAAGLDNLILPGYSVFDAALYYTVNNFRIAANLNNLTDQTYWVGGYASNRIFPGAPRSVLVSVGYSF
ncbi:MAG: TonB-dependent siderophore receptor [Gemmatimonas sp.]|nr:TonB-dependent siderophore receptor [Gemmatimonas sp.]